MTQLDKLHVLRIIKAAVKEDVSLGDITTNIVVPKAKNADAVIIARERCVICGVNVAEWIINEIDPTVSFEPMVRDGDAVNASQEIAYLKGRAGSILTAERTMLNFMSFMSGIASETRKYADKVKAQGVKILDTRKTLPLLRYLEKYAVSVGGGYNHRMNLNEMVLVKDNHLFIRGNTISVNEIRKRVQKGVKIEVEVENLKDFAAVMQESPDVIMLDNMTPAEIKKAVSMRNLNPEGRGVTLEASGGITLDNIEQYGQTGVDTISIGCITDSVKGVDLSLDFVKVR